VKDELRRLLASDPERSDRARRFFGDAPEPDEDLGEVLLEARLAAAEHFDPSSSPTSLWLVRLAGAHIEDGWLDSHLQDSIVGPLSREVEQATPSKARRDARLGLVGVTTGSVVLHFRPRVAKNEPDDAHLSFPTSAVDAAISRVTHLHDLLEQGAPAAQIASLFKDEQPLLRQARQLITALTENSVELSTRWWASDSRRTNSRLTFAGQQHALEVFESAIHREFEHVQGMVTGLDIDGIVTVSGAVKARWKVNVGRDAIHSPRFSLGAHVHLLALKEAEVDKVGNRLSHPTFTFVRHIEHSELPIDAVGGDEA
jgi:hypothetical protein